MRGTFGAGPGTIVQTPLANDLDAVTRQTARDFEELRGQRLFITGGTGFWGCWLLETFLHANETLKLNARAVVLTRDPDAFLRRTPHLARSSAISLLQGDVKSFDFPEGAFSHVIHAAADFTPAAIENRPLEVLDTIVQGTRRTLDFALRCGARKFLLASSGAVYGTQPPEVSHIGEDDSGAPNITTSRSAYAEGKRIAELLCCIYAEKHGLETKLARGFAFIGPYLPLDAHYAASSFLRAGLRGEELQISGDGTPCRSYLYASDLAVWLWAILFRGHSARPYNVGSERAVTIAVLAQAISRAFGGIEIKIAKQPPPGRPAERYVPSVQRAATELGLTQTVELDDAIARTIRWHRERQNESAEEGEKGRKRRKD